ncbi:MAG: serine/threonine-protein kinase, partial [Planctomycetota bacterium]
MIGTKLSDRYEVTGELGRGGMGVVYRAHDPFLDREVAVKLVAPSQLTDEAEERFEREAQLVGKMDHPAIVPIYDFGRHEDMLFLVMPVIPGSSLRPFLRDQSLLLGDVIDVGCQVAEALDYSHNAGVVHRDIKPENIMVAREEAGGVRVRVMDFGLARVSTATRLTQTGVLVGTMSYLSPEQVLSQGIDGRTDIYSLGTVLYECITGRPPFAGEMQSILYRIVHELPQAPTTLGADIPEELEQVLLSCLAKEPGERPSSAGKLAEELGRCRSQLGETGRNRSMLLSGSGHVQPPALAPFVGRKPEVAELQKRLNAAIAGECQFVMVGGEPGSGKTRLLDELEGLAKARGLRVLHGRFMEQNRSFPYQGFCEAIQEYYRQKEVGSSSSQLPDLSDLAPDLVALFPMLAEIGEISSAAQGEGKLAQSPENKTQVFELLARALIRIAGGKPLVLLLEDLHGAEVSIEAVQYVVPRLGPTPTFVIGTYRTNEITRHHPVSRMIDAFEGDRRFASVTLGPFTPSEHRKFLETLVGGAELADDLVEKVFEKTEGDPFFTKELVRSLLDSGAIGRDDTGQWSLTGQTGVRTEELPATIQQAVEKRIQRLPNDLRDVLTIASVLGKTFDFRDLEALAADRGEVEDAVDKLIEEGLIEEQRDSRADLLTFNSGVVRDVLYGQLSRRKRRSLHRRCGEQLEKRQKGRLDRIYPQLLYHFSEGDEPERTVEYGLELARRSLDTFSPEEAIRATRTALEFLDDEWEGDRDVEGTARALLAHGHRLAGDIDSALIEIERAIDVFASCEDEARAADAILFAAKTAWQSRRTEETTRWVEAGIERARRSGRAEALKEHLSLAATLANLKGEYEKANELLVEAHSLERDDQEATEEEEIPTGGRLIV